jgi:hypothetical protein
VIHTIVSTVVPTLAHLLLSCINTLSKGVDADRVIILPNLLLALAARFFRIVAPDIDF